MPDELYRTELAEKAIALAQKFEYNKSLQIVRSTREKQSQISLIGQLIEIADSMRICVGKFIFLYEISTCCAELGQLEIAIETANKIDDKHEREKASALASIWASCICIGNDDLALEMAQRINYNYCSSLSDSSFRMYLKERYEAALAKEIQEGYILGSPLNQNLLAHQNYLCIEDRDALIFQAQFYAKTRNRKCNPSKEDSLKEAKEIANNLASELGTDYAQLIVFLKEGEWEKADYETYLLIRRILNRIEKYSCEEEQVLPFGHISPVLEHISKIIKFPCEDLKIIDRLWTTNSQGHFGFSIQKQIWFALLDKFRDSAHEVHQWERHGIENLSPESEVERCRNFKPRKEDEIFAEMVGWYKNNNPWPCNNWREPRYSDLSPFDLKVPKGHLPVFWAYQFSTLYSCTTLANGGVMISFGVGLGESYWHRTGTNFFEIVNSCNL